MQLHGRTSVFQALGRGKAAKLAPARPSRPEQSVNHSHLPCTQLLGCSSALSGRIRLRAAAYGNRPIQASAVAEERALAVVDQTFPLPKGNAQVRVRVMEAPNGSQTIFVSTGLQAGRLLLHWGVEGGKDYKGGWRLPGAACRPEGTIQYKDRALQSPFTQRGDRSELYIELNGDEASDLMNFVLKDDATNTWYDNNGSNFRVPLRPDADTAPPKIEVLPKQLCDKWAWVRWDNEGRPPRSEEQASEDYDLGVQEMKALMDKGRLIDELWRVAESKWKYGDYREKVVKPTIGDIFAVRSTKQPRGASQSKSPSPQVAVGPVPEDLLAVMAYVLWERAGKPQGADFSNDARKEIQNRTGQGLSYEQIAQQLNYTPKWTSASLSSVDQGRSKTPDVPAAPPPPPKKAEVGKPLGAPSRNPLDMIKQSNGAPVLSQDKGTKRESPLEFLVQRFALDNNTQWRRVFNLGNQSGELLAVVRQCRDNEPVRVDFISDAPNPLVLHWGVNKPGSKEWLIPPEEVWPEDTYVAGHACETAFLDCDDHECDVSMLGAEVPLQRLTVTVPPDSWVGGLCMVLRSSDSTMWYKDGGGNFMIPVPCKHAPEPQQYEGGDVFSRLPDDLTRAIVEAEQTSMWTLMHRFNRAADLINEVLNGYYDMDVTDAFSRIYVWLRYSATRKLTWQRNYNTQPRILSAAQERLTNTIANAHARTTGEAQEWVRSMFTCVGRGGDGQKIRDEILNIMHRNHIPEKKGTWMEEWHQKLHNNTTPDDVPICEAYLAFLQQNGNNSAYWRVLSDAGISRQRLEGFDRPIVQEPQWFPDKKDSLIRDFRNYLGILKAVHSGADLQASAAAAGNKIPNSARGYLGYVLGHVGDSQILPLMEAAVEARTELSHSLPGNRELLYLDLALEDQIRQAAERGIGGAGFGAAAYMRPLLQNLCLSLGDNEELCYCLKAWLELPGSVKNGGRPNKEEALQAVAVINRIRRAISQVSDSVTHRIGYISRVMGEAFGVEAWARDLFAEEVVRGGPAFAVSLLITSIEAHLRNAAALGAWQVISPQQATGRVEVVTGLHEVQDKTYETPTVLLAQQVTGEEEIPEGVVAVLTPDAPDVLSHVSVRARNMRVLFATCHDKEPLEQIKAAAGKTLHFNTTASGSVSWTEVKGTDTHTHSHPAHDKPTKGLVIDVPIWSGKWVVGMDEYRDGVVGAKSKNLAGLRGKLPDHIKLPSSVTLPFGCYEQVLDANENKEIKMRIRELVSQLAGRSKAHSNGNGNGNGSGGHHGNGSQHSSGQEPAELLERCRELAMQVKVPEVVRRELEGAMKKAGVPVPESEARWKMAIEALKGVWASKYNDRAYYSLKKVGLNFDDVRMAVLVQRVVPAQYAFVIHTRNPSNNDESEIFCELVLGLGESLVSGMIAGSAVAFKASKDNLDNPEVLCYASKSEGMFVRESLIFRSDSNGEDLEGYAGAGLYESITMDPTETKKVDYMDDKLVQDPKFRKNLLASICKVGAAIEKALGSAQDIEGVVGPDGTITVVQTRPQV